MDWMWLLMPVALVVGVCAGLWIKSRARNHAATAAAAYGGGEAGSTYSNDHGGDSGGGGGD